MASLVFSVDDSLFAFLVFCVLNINSALNFLSHNFISSIFLLLSSSDSNTYIISVLSLWICPKTNFLFLLFVIRSYVSVFLFSKIFPNILFLHFHQLLNFHFRFYFQSFFFYHLVPFLQHPIIIDAIASPLLQVNSNIAIE